MPDSRSTTLLSSLGVWLVLALAGLAAARPLWHDDLFFHLHAGRLIFESGAVLRVDPFSHTMPGAPWTTHEWGFALLVDRVYALAGLQGLVALGSLLVVACFALLDRVLRRLIDTDRTALRVVLLVLGVLAVERAMFIVRAALLSSLALVTLQYLLHRHHAARRQGVLTGAIVLLIWVWANVHVGVVFGLCVLATYCAQGVVDALGQRAELGLPGALRGLLLPRVLLLLGCTAATLVNPNGLSLWTFAFELNDLYYNSGMTWTMGMFGPPALERYPFFYLTIACCLLACLPLRALLSALRSSERPALMQTLCMLMFLPLALRSMRFVPDFTLFALPFCALAWGRAGPVTAASWARSGLRLASLPTVVCAALLLQPEWPSDPLPVTTPRRLASFMEREAVRGTMFNPEAVGGYLGWRLGLPVYWDGRNDVFGPLAKELAFTRDRGLLVERHQLDMLVLDRTYYENFAPFLQAHGAEWGCVYFDDYVSLYLKRGPRFDALLARRAYRLLRPFGVPSEAAVAQVAGVARMRTALERDLAQLKADSGPTEVESYVRSGLSRADASAAARPPR